MNKQSKFWPWMLAFVVLAVLSSYIRLYPLRVHLWDDSRDQATLLVITNLKQALLKQILSQVPNMPPAYANHLADEKLNETMHVHRQKVMDTIDRVAISLSHQPGAKPQKVYLLESDGYDFYNLTENITRKGSIADIIKGSKYFNPLMVAPFGFWQPFTLHPYWGFIIYKFLSILHPTIPLMKAVACTPLFTYLFIIAASLWVCRILGFSAVSSFLGTLFLVMAPINLKRGALGWYRTDPYAVLFPLLLLGCLILALRAVSKKETCLWAVMFGLILSVFALFWQGWVLLFFIGMACALGVAAYNFFILKDKAHARHNLLFIGLFMAASFLLVGLFFSFQDFFILFKEAFWELKKFTHRGLDLWPNLFMAVGELKKPGWGSILSLGSVTTPGGAPDFWPDVSLILVASVGWVLSFKQAFKNFRQTYAIDVLVITIFLVITMTLSLYGERFIFFITIPLSILAAAAVERFNKPRALRLSLASLLTILVLFTANHDIRVILTPIFNSAWDEALTKVKAETPADSIVNSWWAPGHFIKGIAHRRVPFDGASLDQSAVGYWMANMFLSQDEAQARGILRMLNTSGNDASSFLTQKCGLKLSDAVNLLMAIAPEDKQAAAVTLKGILNPDQIRSLLLLTHGPKPHSYVLIYTELVEANAMLAFSAHWNIKKIEEVNADPDMLKNLPNRNSRDFIEFLWNTMGGLPKYSEPLSLLGKNDNQLVFRENLAIDLNTMDAQIQSTQYGAGRPLSVFYLKHGEVVEHENPDGNLNYAVVLYQQDGQYAVRLMDRALANSLIMKLYFFDGSGLKYFKPSALSQDATGRTRIKVFKVIY